MRPWDPLSMPTMLMRFHLNQSNLHQFEWHFYSVLGVCISVLGPWRRPEQSITHVFLSSPI